MNRMIQVIYNIFASVWRKIRHSKKLRRRIAGICIFVFVGLIVIVELVKASMAPDKKIYIKTSLASQTGTDVLLSQEPNKDDNWIKSESISQLHIKEGFVKKEISQEMFDYYEGIFSEICKNGKKMQLDENGRRNIKEEEYFSMNTKYIQEAKKWKKSYDREGVLGCLYHYGRSLNEAAMTFEDMPFMDRLEIAADSVSIEEEFLSCSDRNINAGGDTPVIINAEKISLMNGKLYLHIAICAEAGNEEEKGYANCLLVEAYKCIEQGRFQISMGNKRYALLTYYQGNIGERILGKISKEDDLYNVLGQKALENYKSSLELIENNPHFYKKEANMKKNLKRGISTLNEKGFF